MAAQFCTRSASPPEEYIYSCQIDDKQRRYEASLQKAGVQATTLIAYGSVCGRTINITSLFTSPDKRQNGLASTLLRYFLRDCLQNGYHTFLLDDCSDYFRQNDKNIYYKQGFRYINEGQPEMKLHYSWPTYTSSTEKDMV